VSDYNLGTARGVIEIEYKGDGAKQASKDLRGTGSAATDADQRMRKASTGMAVAGAVIAGGLALAVNSAADFEKQLSNVQAVSGASADEMEVLRNKSLQLGKDTAFSASESAMAIEELVKAGVSVQDVMAGAADATVNLAAAGEISMPEAAAIASNAMNQFGLAAKELPKVADNIAGAANASAIDVKDFGYSLSQVGAVANLAGVTFEDTATAIALMGNAGIKGSDAGTSLKSMFMRLQPTTKKQAELMQELGIITEDGANKFYDAEGNMRSMADVSQTLQDALKGMSKEQQQATLTTLFGADAIRGAAILANNGAEGFGKMADAMGKVTAADVAATRMDNLEGSIEQLKGSLETLMIMIGTPLLNGIRGIVDGLTGFLDIVLSIPGPILEAITVFAAMLAGLLLLVSGFMKVRLAIQAMQAGLLLFTGPILLVIAAIAALVAAFAYFYKNNAKFRAFVQEMASALKDLFGQAIEWIVPKLKEFGQFLMTVFQASLPYIKQFGDFLVSAFNAILPYIQKVISFMSELAGIFMDEVVPVIQEVAGTILDSLVGAFNKVVPEIMPMIEAVKDFVSSILDLGKAIMGTPAFQFLIDVFQTIAQMFVGTILPLLVRVGGVFYNVFVQVLGTALQTALAVIRNVFGIFSGIIKIFTGLLTGNWSKAWEGVKQVLRSAVGVIGAVLRGLLSTAGSILKGLGNLLLAGIKAIPGMLKGAGGLFLSAGKFLINAFADGMKSAAGIIEGIASNVWNFVRGLLNGAISRINRALEFTIDPPGPGKVTINPPDIPALAKGGVLTAPTMAWVAEAGHDEAVIPLRDLWRQMDQVYRAGQVAIVDSDSLPRGRTASSGSNGDSGRSRLVQGTLRLDPSGRAFIEGVAQDVYDDNEDQTTTMSRMSGRR